MYHVLFLLSLGSLALAQDFNWKAFEGENLKLLLQDNLYQQALIAELPAFTELTGINVTYDMSETYYDDMTLDLARGKSSQYDVFVTDVYHLWQFAPAGWLEKLEPYLNDSSKTSPDYDVDDIILGLRNSTKWNLEIGPQHLGQGSQYGLPFSLETSFLVYHHDFFAQHNLSVPTTVDELLELVQQLNKLEPDSFALSNDFMTFISLYFGHGCKDFDETMTPQMNSECAAQVTTAWLELLKQARNPNGDDFNNGKTRLMITNNLRDLDNATVMPIFDGQHSHVSMDALVMNARSKHKDAAWLFMQWASSKDTLNTLVTEYKLLNPVRTSSWENQDFQEGISPYTNYIETIKLIMPTIKIQFAPQPLFFEITAEWANALDDIYNGADIQKRLDELAASITKKLENARVH